MGVHNQKENPLKLPCSNLGGQGVSKAARREPTSSAKSGVWKSLKNRPRPAGERMTAEIAIANRTALALAADSAVTIRVGNKTKIYDSAEKIFELSRRQPIGLMIYNNVEFVNVPLDVVIRKFRSEEKKIYKFVKPAADHFLAYIEKFSRDGIDEKSHLFPLLFEHYRSLQVRV